LFTLIIIIIINIYFIAPCHHKLVTSEALGPGSVCRGRREILGKGNVFRLVLNTATESVMRTDSGSEFQTASAQWLKTDI